MTQPTDNLCALTSELYQLRLERAVFKGTKCNPHDLQVAIPQRAALNGGRLVSTWRDWSENARHEFVSGLWREILELRALNYKAAAKRMAA